MSVCGSVSNETIQNASLYDVVMGTVASGASGSEARMGSVPSPQRDGLGLGV
jgi:hypothetical protein